MSTEARIAANRQNALASTGPRTAPGKTRVSRNAVTLGLFTMNDFVLSEESAEHEIFCSEFWRDLNPAGPVQETFATEMIRAAWRLRRCGLIEAALAEDPDSQNEANARTQQAVDRARAQANNIFRRAHQDLRRLQDERQNGFVFSDRPEPARPAKSELTNQTQSIPRSGPCPCRSGEKYKRCCGRNAPPILHRAA